MCYLAIVVLMYTTQHKLLFFPLSEVAVTPESVGIEYKDVWLTNRLETSIHGWWVPAEASPLVILFSHGNGGNLSHRVSTISIFHDMGVSSLLYDYSGYGLSQGAPSETGTYADARAAWDWLVQEQGISPDRIVLFGRSLGGAVTARLAAELAAEDTKPAGLVLESTFTSVPDIAAALYPWLPVRLLARYDYDSVAALAALDLPILFAHSEDDEIVPYDLGYQLYEGYDGPKGFLPMVGGHNTGYMEMGRDYPDGLAAFFATLGRAP